MKPIFTKALMLVFVVLSAINAQAQDAQFSQFFNAPVRLNPAMTGLFNGSYRVGANYRDQWSSIIGSSNAFRTYGAAADMNFFIMKADVAGLGLQVVRDEAGAGQFTNTTAVLSGSYVKQLSGRRRGWKQAEHYLSGGLQIGMGQNTISSGKYQFSRQYDPQSGFSENNASGENFATDSKTYIDLNAGLMWYALFNEHLSLYAGGSANHINQPNIGFFSRAEPLYMRYSANVGGEIPVSREISLLPGALFWKQGPAMQTELGLNVRYSNRDWREFVLKAGVWDRLPGSKDAPISQDALILFAGVDYERLSIGFSYDLNMSNLRAVSNARGAYELSIMYIHPPKRRLGVACPRFR
jgi:type IX secretion system PorP/SprF family membrane protein